MKYKTILLLTLIFTLVNEACEQQSNETYNSGSIYNSVIYPGEGDLFSLAEYRIWVPDNLKRINGIIVHQHGCGRNGLSMPYDVHWQSLARKWGFALLGSHYVATDSCTTWNNPKYGSEEAFLSGISSLGLKSDHPELDSVPWVLWGHSGGGRWVINMLNLHPERIIAVFARSGGGVFTPEALQVPVVFNYGLTDSRPDFYRQSYMNGRDAGGLFAVALDSTTGHDCGNSRLLSIPFFDECIAIRMAKDGNRNYSLKDTSTSEFWLGDPATGNIYEGKTYQGDKSQLSWLISENIAKVWQEFIRTGSVTDITAPLKAPSIVGSKIIHNTVVIYFSLDADMESGVKDVILYRDEKEIKKYIGYNDTYNEKHFQHANFGDEPLPESMYENVNMWIPAILQFTDYRLETGKTYNYSIKFTNWSDLESPESEVHRVIIP